MMTNFTGDENHQTFEELHCSGELTAGIEHQLIFLSVLNIVLSFRAVFTWLSKGIGFGFGFGFTTPFGWLVYLLWFWFYDSQVKTTLLHFLGMFCS